MSKGQLVITAVVVEGRSKSEVARDYDVSRQWVQQLCRRYAAEGATAFGRAHDAPHQCPSGAPRRRRPHPSAPQKPHQARLRCRRRNNRRPPRRRPTTNVPAVSTIGRILTVETAQAEISLSGSRS